MTGIFRLIHAVTVGDAESLQGANNGTTVMVNPMDLPYLDSVKFIS